MVVAIALFVAGALHSGDLGLELEKGGIELLVVVILGGLVGFAFRNLDAQRDERRRLDDYRAAFVDDLWKTYHRIKAVRRTLRAYGFDSSSGALTEEQCREYDLQMKELDDAQLSLETLKRGVETDDGRIFGEQRKKELFCRLKRAENYVNEVIGDWEAHRSEVKPEATRETALKGQAHLRDFLDKAHAEQGMATQLSERIEDAVAYVQKLRFSS